MSVHAVLPDKGAEDQHRVESALFHRARISPTSTALVEGDHPCDYATLARRALHVAARLEAAGLEPGDRVAVYLDKTTECVVSIYGAWRAGAIVVPVNESLRSRQVGHIVGHSGARFFISSPRKHRHLDPEATQNTLDLSGETESAAESAPTRLRPNSDTDASAPAAILYTSGSTGRPKGILLSHENLIAGARIVSAYLGIDAQDRILSVLPFSFDYGLNQLLISVAQGATLCLQRSPLPADIVRSLERERITAMAGVPPLWVQLMQAHSPLPNASLPDLRLITSSGGVFPEDVLARYRDAFPELDVFLMYGLSEAFRSTYLPPEEAARRPTSMGRAIPETCLYVLDAEGRECAPGEAGELVHCGPTVAMGYWSDDESTARVFRECPLQRGQRAVYSGDLVKRDAEHFFYFVARRDQLIKTQGYRVSPEEVEEVLFSSGMLQEVVVRGVPDTVAGAVIAAHVVPEGPNFSESALFRFCRREMPSYMVPKVLHVEERLPRTPSGKMDRNALAP